MFYVCYLRKWLGDKLQLFPFEKNCIDENKMLIEEPKAILAKETKKMRRKMFDLVLVKWKNTSGSNLHVIP